MVTVTEPNKGNQLQEKINMCIVAKMWTDRNNKEKIGITFIQVKCSPSRAVNCHASLGLIITHVLSINCKNHYNTQHFISHRHANHTICAPGAKHKLTSFLYFT